MLLLCWLAAFVAGLGEMVVFRSRVFNGLYLLWESVGCVSIETVKNGKHSKQLCFGQFISAICWCVLLIPRCTCCFRCVCGLRWSSKQCFLLELGVGRANVLVSRFRGVGRTHTIVRLQTRIRRKDGTENFGAFVYVLDLI